MSLKIFLRIIAVWAAALGMVWVTNPQAGLSAQDSAYAVMIARVLGADLIMIGLMTWIASGLAYKVQYVFLIPNVFVHAVPAALIVTNIANGSFTSSNWVGFVLHIIPLLGCLIFLALRPGHTKTSA